MASLEDSMLASAIESLNIETYWPTFDSHQDIETDDDSEYSIILYFYECLLDELIKKWCVQSEHLESAIKYLVKNHGALSQNKDIDFLNYNKLSNCLGYLHRYAACHTALVHTVMLRIFHIRPPAVIRRILALKNHMKMVCVGSGPGNDLVGILSALYGKHYGLLNIDVAVVDKMVGWQCVFEETRKRLKRGLCGNASKTFVESNVSTSFIQADVKFPETWTAEMNNKLSTADIITLIKFLGIIPKKDKQVILKNIVLSMKPGSVLIFIDCPFPAAEFQALANYLDTVYEATKEKFDFNFEVSRFGYPNITASRAFIRVFVRKFIVANERQR